MRRGGHPDDRDSVTDMTLLVNYSVFAAKIFAKKVEIGVLLCGVAWCLVLPEYLKVILFTVFSIQFYNKQMVRKVSSVGIRTHPLEHESPPITGPI